MQTTAIFVTFVAGLALGALAMWVALRRTAVTPTDDVAQLAAAQAERHLAEGETERAFEVADALGRAPDIHVLPVGNAGNYTAYHRGYREELARGEATTLPRMFGFQA